jgi:putative transposase
VAEIYEIEPNDTFSKGKQRRKVQARSLFCFWAVSELDISLRELARRLEMSSPGVGYSVERGEVVARIHKYHLVD